MIVFLLPNKNQYPFTLCYFINASSFYMTLSTSYFSLGPMPSVLRCETHTKLLPCVSGALFGTRKIASPDKDATITRAICVANVWTFTTGFKHKEIFYKTLLLVAKIRIRAGIVCLILTVTDLVTGHSLSQIHISSSSLQSFTCRLQYLIFSLLVPYRNSVTRSDCSLRPTHIQS